MAHFAHPLLRPIIVALGVLLLAGCETTSYDVKVDAIAHEEKASGESYRIVTKNGQDPNTDLRTKEAVEYVKTALSGRGMYEAPTPESADMVVEVDFDVEPPRVEFETRTVPQMVHIPGGVSSRVVPIRDKDGNVQWRPVMVREMPRQELVGYEEKVIPITVYEKYMRVSARENVSSGDDTPPEELWSVYVSNENEDDDLRKALPVLASVVVDYIGETTEEDAEVKVDSRTAEVEFIKRGM